MPSTSPSRRRFLRSLLAVPLAGAVPWQRLLAPPLRPGLDLAALNAATTRHLDSPVVDAFFRDDPLIAYVKAHKLGTVGQAGRRWTRGEGSHPVPVPVPGSPRAARLAPGLTGS